MNTEERAKTLMKQGTVTLVDIETWAKKLHALGKECRLPINGRMRKELKLHGRTYLLIEVNEKQRRDYVSEEYLDGIPQPCFMGNEGYALREIIK